MSSSKIQQWFPWTEAPVIVNAPMAGAVSPELAAEVSKAGGLGMCLLGCIADVSENSPQVTKLDADLTKIRQLLGGGDDDSADSTTTTTPSGRLRVGAGFLTCHPSIGSFAATALPVIRRHRPAAVWLFAPHEHIRPQGEIVRLLKGLGKDDEEGVTAPKVFVQVGNVAAAREALEDGADAVVCQGTDAGGHQYRRGMGVVPLLAETRRLVDEGGCYGGDEGVCVLAAGGIADGKSVAAMLTLEADAVVMGTRFTVAKESIVPDFRKQIILEASDGALSTLKSPFNDQIAGSALWGSLYDGRAVVGPIHEKFLAGASLDECWRELHEDHSPEEATRLINTWAGAAIGMVRKEQPAGEIVREVREEARQAIRKVAARV
ncbi:inosine monophosphate dehydrogenase [Trichoderma citrinoviride]|uniref:Inosine monophosphate dehydrogenase n=1 Tax=Trichoderma citrinoviride TaxID=58853 RepID=A0A2T4BK37_9HYPO|nr:inosine monophosphate dehydrogenase [Trichoderma citrinoviride]PTB69670.1 inosine monophosphate dehydrogenase [Trichoderma citrinoviride]